MDRFEDRPSAAGAVVRLGVCLQRMLLALGMSCIPLTGGAACSWYKSTSTVPLIVPVDSPLVIPRDLPVGSLLWDSQWQGDGAPEVYCKSGDTVTGGYVLPVGDEYAGRKIYATTSVPGIGIKVGWVNSIGMAPEIDDSSVMTPDRTHVYASGFGRGPFTPVSRYRVQLYKIGDIDTSQTLNFPGIVAESKYGNLITNQLTIAPTQVVVQTASCLAGDVAVQMGTHSTAAFGAHNRIAESQRDFDITLTRCPAGMHRIRYGFHAGHGYAGAAADGVAKLRNEGGAATGVGVLIEDRGTGSPAPITFDTSQESSPVVASYDTNASGQTLHIPLRASYVKTTGPVSPGRADSEVEFTIYYE